MVLDGVLDSIAVTTRITEADETVKAVVVTDFTDLGTAQEISAPAPDEVRDYGWDEVSPELEELFATVDDFNDRHPQECIGVDLTDDSFPTCMEKAGKAEAAHEVRRLQKLIPIEDWGA